MVGMLRYLLVLAVFGFAFWLTPHLTGEWDLSASARHSLSPTTREVLDRLEQPVRVTAYVKDSPELRRAVRDLVQPYARYQPALELRFVDPTEAVEEARSLGIPASGAVLVELGQSSELLRQLSETTLTNALQRLMTRGEHWIIGLRGHGERLLEGDANHDLRDFGAALKREGYQLQTLDLPATMAIPDNTAVLLIADPRAVFTLSEQAVIADYLSRGGNLLWLADPDPSGASRWLEDQLPVNRLPGTLVDAQGARLGIDDPRLIATASYGDHPVTAHLQGTSLFPRTAGLSLRATASDWAATFLAHSSGSSWNETGDVQGAIQRDEAAGEQRGPLPLGLALERDSQRVIIIGDGDFLSNAYLGNGVNLDLGLNMVRWLSGNDRLLDIPAPASPDARLELSRWEVALLAAVFLVGIPGAMMLSGVLIHFRRRRR